MKSVVLQNGMVTQQILVSVITGSNPGESTNYVESNSFDKALTFQFNGHKFDTHLPLIFLFNFLKEDIHAKKYCKC